ncbi:MAG: hypothetical protein WHT06_04950 [Desulfobacterales bacterium]
MKKTSFVGILGVGVLLLAAACAGNHPLREETVHDRNWGRAVEGAKFNQILDPQAGGTDKPVEGISGRPAGNTVERYEQSFKKEQRELPVSTTTSVMK